MVMAVWCEHTPESAKAAEWVETARKFYNESLKTFCVKMRDLGERQYKRQIAGTEHLSFYRIVSLPVPMQRVIHKLWGDHLGVIVLEDARIASMNHHLNELQVKMLRLELAQYEARRIEKAS